MRNKKNFLIAIIIAVCLSILIGGIIAGMLFDWKFMILFTVLCICHMMVLFFDDKHSLGACIEIATLLVLGVYMMLNYC